MTTEEKLAKDERVEKNALRKRAKVRLLSGSDPGGNTSESGSVSGEEGERLEREFDAEYDSVNLMRISGMSREEVVENDRLKKLLEENNIDYEEILSAKRRRSGDSFESDVSAVLASECSLDPQQSDLM
uniref:Uncharacterized protein n=1 Tax=Parascaris equorum TaxID=6256 RepID=A0A914RDI3_PAREQ